MREKIKNLSLLFLVLFASIFYFEIRTGAFFGKHKLLTQATSLISTQEANAQYCVQQGGCNWVDWWCTCSGDHSGSYEGGATFCMKCQGGEITKIAVGKSPYTKATGSSNDFRCGGSAKLAPNPVLHLNDPTPGATVSVWWWFWGYGN